MFDFRLPYLGKFINPVIFDIVIHVIMILAEQVERVHEATKHCMGDETDAWDGNSKW